MFPIRVSVNSNLKVVQIWMTQDEKENNGDYEKILAYADSIKENKKYKTIVYISGDHDLFSTTADLLKRNRGAS